MSAEEPLWEDAAHRWKERALRAEATADVLAQVLDHVAYVIQEHQPQPRTASVTYVAGYARAMADVRAAILEARNRATATLPGIAAATIAPRIVPARDGTRKP